MFFEVTGMTRTWKYTKKAHKQLCAKCGDLLGPDDILLCYFCRQEHNYSPNKRWQRK